MLRYLDLEPEDFDALLLLGLSLEQSDDPSQAEKVFQEALRRRPQHADARLFLARTMYKQRRFSLAAKHLRAAEELGADAGRVRYLQGLVLREQGELAEALAAFRQAGATSGAPLRASEVLLEMGRPGDALRELAEAPDTADSRYQRALALVALDERSKAIAELRQIGDHTAGRALLRRLQQSSATPARASGLQKKDPVPVRFVERGGAAGLDFVLDNSPTPEKYLPETMAGGLAAFDANGDGLLDLFFANGATTPTLEKERPRHSNRLYLNEGGLRFTDATAKAGLEGRGFSIGAAAGDYDNDGDVDLFVAGVRNNLLYRNRGDGRFDEVTAEAGLQSDYWAVGAGWFDYDRDGLLDLFVANYLDWNAATAPVCQDERSKVRTYCHPKFFGRQPNQLYRNLGDGAFEDVSEATGIHAHPGKAMSLAIGDVDQDGDLDVFVPNDAVANSLFLNGGRGVFEEAALSAGVALKDDGKAVSAMGAALGDADGDGWLDLIFTALPGETFPYFRNEGDGVFLDRTFRSRIGALSRQFGGWGVALADFNNDGAADVLAATSHVMDNAARFSSEAYEQANALWLNRGDGTFADASAASGLARRSAAHRGLVVADFDDDGRLDAVVTVLGAKPELWHNQTDQSGCWLELRFRGHESNRDGVGVRVTVRGRSFEHSPASGYAASSAGPLHIGLGTCKTPVLADVSWPSGRKQSIEIAHINRGIEVLEPYR